MSSTTATPGSPVSRPAAEPITADHWAADAAGHCYRRALTISRPAVAREDRMEADGGPSNTAVHVDLHNLWTSRWTGAVAVWRPRGTRTGREQQPARHLRNRSAQGVDGRKSPTFSDPTRPACRGVLAGHTRPTATRATAL